MNPNCSQRARTAISALILYIGLFFNAISVEADQWGDWTYSLSGGNVTITNYTGAGGSVSIPSSIYGFPVCSIGNFSFANKSNITSIIIPEGVTNIGVGAFFQCDTLETIRIPSSVVILGYRAFDRCESLNAINVNSANPLYSSVGGVLFDKSKTKLIRYPSAWRSGIPLVIATKFTIPDTVTIIGSNAFAYCTNLTSLTVGANVSSVEWHAFFACSSLTAIYFRGNPPAIQRYALPPTTVYYFWGSTGWEATYDSQPTVLLPYTYMNNSGGITITGYKGSDSKVTIPSTFNCLPVNGLADYAFSYSTSLTNITIPASIIRIANATFYTSYCLQSITVDALNSAYSSLDGVLFDKNQTTLIYCPQGRGGNYTIPCGTMCIGSNAFRAYGCGGVVNVTVPNTVTNIDDGAFSQNEQLTALFFNGNSPTLGSAVFFGDINLTVFYFPWTSGWTDTFGGRPTQINPAYTQWLLNHNFSTNGMSSTTNDFDNDGMLNWQEYLSGTSPTNDADKLAISSMGSETNTALLTWQAKSNVSYQVMKSDDLHETWMNAPSGQGTNQQSFKTAPVDGVLEYADPDYAGSTNAFYRVKVVQ